MAREKLKDFLSSAGISSTSNRLTFTLSDNDGDGMVDYLDDLAVDPGTHKKLLDLDSRSTGLLGDFLKFIVDETNNAFKLQGGNFEASTTNRGDSLPSAETQGAESIFVKVGTELGIELGAYSNSGKFDGTSKTLSNIINKTGPDDQSSHRILSSIKGSDIDTTGKTIVDTPDESQTDVTRSSEEILLRYNRFKPGKNGRAYAEKPISVDDFSAGVNDSGTSTSQREFGKFDTNGVKMVMNKLKKVGASLVLKSAGWDSSVHPGISADPDDFDFGSAANPDPSDGSRGVDPQVLRSKNAAGAPELSMGTSTRTGRGEVISLSDLAEANRSYGTTTTHGTQFSSASNSLLRAQAVGAIITLLEASQDMFSAIEMLVKSTGGEDDSKANLGRGPFLMGESDPSLSARLQLLRNLVLTRTEYNYTDCVKAGLKIFFSDGASIRGSSDDSQISDYQHVQEAPGFWLAVARTVIRSVNTARGDIDATMSNVFDAGSVANFVLTLGKTKIIGFLNSAATVGDSMLKLTGGNTDILNIRETSGPRDVDSLPLSPGTRIAKSRSGEGSTAMSLAWRNGALPSLYTLPTNVISAAQKMGTIFDGTNPARGMLGSRLVSKTYVDPSGEGDKARISSNVVHTVENLLDAEYVPFYFHDLRTNEIVAFHAFLKNLTEGYTANYAESSGYGRIDPVLSYNNTKRTVNLTFAVVATSKEDFDEMWWKINKLTTLVYPKWTEGTRVTNAQADSSFIVPFSQVLGASPMIRLRIGDVIKSNYSKFNLARLFGVGNTDINPKVDTSSDSGLSSLRSSIGSFMNKFDELHRKLFYIAFGSPVAMVESMSFGSSAGASLAQAALSAAATAASVNGFANPLGVAAALRELTDPDTVINPGISTMTVGGVIEAAAGALLGNNTSLFGYSNSIHLLKANQEKGYRLVDSEFRSSPGTRFHTMRPVRVLVTGRRTRNMTTLQRKRDTNRNSSFKGPRRGGQIDQKTIYTVMVIDFNAPYDMFGATFEATHADIIPSYHSIFAKTAGPILSGIAGTAEAAAEAVVKEAASALGLPTDEIDLFPTETSQFMDPDNNAIVRSFNTTRGRGLPGFIRSMNFNWLEGTWETDWNSRAPKYANIQLSFDVVHDLPPGIDYSGFNRAPLYNVGDIMRSVAGDPYDDDGASSFDTYTAAGADGFRSVKETDN